MTRALIIEVAKLLAVALTFAIVMPMLLIGRWLLIGGINLVQLMSRVVGRK